MTSTHDLAARTRFLCVHVFWVWGRSFHQKPCASVRGKAALCVRGPSLPCADSANEWGTRGWFQRQGETSVSLTHVVTLSLALGSYILEKIAYLSWAAPSVIQMREKFIVTQRREGMWNTIPLSLERGTMVRILAKLFWSWESNKQNLTFMRLPFCCREAGTKFKYVV